MREAVLGWDVGGAHLKAVLVDADGAATLAFELPCPLWQGVSCLTRAIDDALARITVSRPSVHAVTMTGELADCFPDRATGIAAIVTALAEQMPNGQLYFFAGRRGFVRAPAVAAATMEIASANWFATAAYLATVKHDALLVDIGSTTTDLTPIVGGAVGAIGYDDFTRLAEDELVYTGVTRTPLMSLAERARFEGREVGLMAEHFATTADVHRLTGALPERVDQHPSADGGPKTIAGSARRLARMVGRDAASAPIDAWIALARFFADRQLERLLLAANRTIVRSRLPGRAPIVAAGVGAFLARELAARLERQYVEFATLAPRAGAAVDDLMACAPAFAVACLLGTSLHGAPR
jgi:probable H4MPT-linked C1 transfer pathway protein